ncbi:MAG: hypothetical protein KBD17_02210 [Candidatus Pacebacteria bacterium]|nr:hypothetical protein [Candidatus Paceibacterota bacterium]
MINLIPNEEKKKIARHFYFRLAVVSLLMVSLVICFTIMAILPSYILSKTKEDVADSKLTMQKSEPVPILDQNTSDAIADLDGKLSLVENLSANKFVVTERVIKEILNSKISDVKISRISYENDSVQGKKIGIDGEASSRERLLLFRQALEDNKAFQNVDLPISNFVKGSNIQFHLSLTPAI